MPIPKDDDGLTEKQRRFVEAYMGEANGNGTRAAKLAGYKGSDATLAVQAQENLRNPKITAHLQRVNEKVRSSAIATISERQAFWTAVMRGERFLYEDELEFSVTGEPVMDPRVDPNSPDPYFKRRVPVSQRLSASAILAKAKGDFVMQFEIKQDNALRAKLVELKKELSPSAYEELCIALAKAESEVK